MTEVKKNFYAVAAGRKTGIFQSWAMCNKQVKQFSGECYEGFTTLNEAVNFMVSRGGYDRDNITVFDKKGAAECPLEEYIKQNDEQCSEPKFVVNELLAYVFYHLDRYPVNNIVNVILQFYHADMICDAKRILWDNYTVMICHQSRKGQIKVISALLKRILKMSWTMSNSLILNIPIKICISLMYLWLQI
jgi:hypothetical protein